MSLRQNDRYLLANSSVFFPSQKQSVHEENEHRVRFINFLIYLFLPYQLIRINFYLHSFFQNFALARIWIAYRVAQMVRTYDFKVQQNKSTNKNVSTFNYALEQRFPHPCRRLSYIFVCNGRGKGCEKLGHFSSSSCGRLIICGVVGFVSWSLSLSKYLLRDHLSSEHNGSAMKHVFLQQINFTVV